MNGAAHVAWAAYAPAQEEFGAMRNAPDSKDDRAKQKGASPLEDKPPQTTFALLIDNPRRPPR